jgi:hypothetical protein
MPRPLPRPLVRTAALAVALLAAAPLSGCVTACSAVGYGYTGPAVIEFAEPPPAGAVVSACFGAGCAPSPLPAPETQERWEVPQETPYSPADSFLAGDVRELRVVVTVDGAVVDDRVHDIPIHSESTGVFGQCPGPFSFEPVLVGS